MFRWSSHNNFDSSTFAYIEYMSAMLRPKGKKATQGESWLWVLRYSVWAFNAQPKSHALISCQCHKTVVFALWIIAILYRGRAWFKGNVCVTKVGIPNTMLREVAPSEQNKRTSLTSGFRERKLGKSCLQDWGGGEYQDDVVCTRVGAAKNEDEILATMLVDAKLQQLVCAVFTKNKLSNLYSKLC